MAILDRHLRWKAQKIREAPEEATNLRLLDIYPPDAP
jgi:hypothetical protein